MSDSTGWVALAALFSAIGAADDEMEEAYTILKSEPVPPSISATARTARDALAIVRIRRAEAKGGT